MALTRWTLLLALGCAGDDKGPPALPEPVQEPTAPDGDDGDDPGEDPLDLGETNPVAQLFRASLDLRGVRPTIAEIERIEADPDAYNALVDEFLADARFGERIRSMFAEIYLTRRDSYSVDADDHGLSPDDQFKFVRSVGDETLYILSTIAEEGLPYTDLVTADWTMANELLASIWPLDYPAGATGWQKAKYNDHRPAAGVLSTNSLWWRYQSTASNANRGKANAISKILLCNDYLSKTVDFDRNVNLLDEDALNDALRTNPGCLACHNTLDPLASYLWGTYYYRYDSPLDLRNYHPEREHLWEDYTGVEPAYYGELGYGLEDLGNQIAADPRFIQCAVERVYSLLTHRDVTVEDTDKLTAFREAFLDDDLKLRTLFKTVATDMDYRATEVVDGPAATRKMVTADMLGSQIEDLTGFKFESNGIPMLETSDGGLRTLAGGVDGVNVTQSATEPMTTLVLVQERVAQAAAWYAVEYDRDHRDEARLFTEIDFHETPKNGETEMVAQVQVLHLRLFGHRVAADGQEVEANLALWEDLYDVSLSVEQAWAGVLTVLLRDPDFLFY
jgi:hypothetical protein